MGPGIFDSVLGEAELARDFERVWSGLDQGHGAFFIKHAEPILCVQGSTCGEGLEFVFGLACLLIGILIFQPQSDYTPCIRADQGRKQSQDRHGGPGIVACGA